MIKYDEFMQKVQLFKHKIEENYDNMEILQIQMHPNTLKDILISNEILQLRPPNIYDNNRKLFGFEVVVDHKIEEGECRFVVRDKE